MILQKHEREALLAAREHLPAGVTVEIEDGRGPKKRLIMTGPRGRVYKVISSSPRSNKAEVGFTRRWARQAVKDVT